MSEKISDIKLVFEQAKMDEYPELYKKYEPIPVRELRI